MRWMLVIGLLSTGCADALKSRLQTDRGTICFDGSRDGEGVWEVRASGMCVPPEATDVEVSCEISRREDNVNIRSIVSWREPFETTDDCVEQSTTCTFDLDEGSYDVYFAGNSAELTVGGDDASDEICLAKPEDTGSEE